MKALETDVKINLETAFFFFSSQGSENVPLCAIVLVLDVFFFKVMLFLNYKGLHSLLFLFKNSTAFSHPFCFLCLGAAFREQIICGKTLFIQKLFSTNLIGSSLLLGTLSLLQKVRLASAPLLPLPIGRQSTFGLINSLALDEALLSGWASFLHVCPPEMFCLVLRRIVFFPTLGGES